MSNYPNMSYCMNQNTLLAMQQVLEAMNNDGPMFIQDMSREELRAYRELFNACEDFLTAAEYIEEEMERDADINGGDTDDGYALASAGFGTDEDYE